MPCQILAAAVARLWWCQSEKEEFFQKLHHQGSQAIDGGFPDDVVDQGFPGETINEGNPIGQEHDLTHQQGADAGSDEKTGKTDVIILQKKLFGEGNDIKSHKKEEGGAGKFQQLMLEKIPYF